MKCEIERASQPPGPICPNPVFVIGSPRSGTTVLATALGQHSDLWKGEESEFLFDLFGKGQLEAVYNKCMARPKLSWLRANEVGYSEFLASLGLGINAMFTSRSCGRRWIEQTPHYALIAELLAGLFPGAQFVHILRDARQVVDSMINVTRRYGEAHLEAVRRSGHLPRWPEDFKFACTSWLQCVEKSLTYCSTHPDRGMTVPYDKLVVDPEPEFRRIFEFLGLTYEEAPATFLSSTRINSSFYRDFSNPKECDPRQEPWENWTPERKVTFLSQLAPMLVKHGLTEALDLGPAGGDEFARQFAAVVQALVPQGATALIVEDGNESLGEIPGCRLLKFSGAPGCGASAAPEVGESAVALLESLRAEGAEWLLVPRSAIRWLDRCRELATRLDARYQLLFRRDDFGAAYDLSERVPCDVRRESTPAATP